MSVLMTTSISNTVFEKIAEEVYNKKCEEEYKKKNPPQAWQKVNFSSIDLPKIAKNSSGKAIHCPDQYVGIVDIKKQGCLHEWYVKWEECYITDDERNQKSDNLCNNDSKVLALVLESPHKKEFDNFFQAGPAKGSTGENIKKYFPQVLFNYLPYKKHKDKIEYDSSKQIPDGKYKVLLINAVQFQCSLGESTTKYRDDIFTNMWNYNVNNDQNVVQDDFKSRLESHSPCVVINCCTKGNFKDKEKDKHLKGLVQKAINDATIPNLLKLRAAHPSSIYFKNGLGFVDEN